MGSPSQEVGSPLVNGMDKYGVASRMHGVRTDDQCIVAADHSVGRFTAWHECVHAQARCMSVCLYRQGAELCWGERADPSRDERLC